MIIGENEMNASRDVGITLYGMQDDKSAIQNSMTMFSRRGAEGDRVVRVGRRVALPEGSPTGFVVCVHIRVGAAVLCYYIIALVHNSY